MCALGLGNGSNCYSAGQGKRPQPKRIWTGPSDPGEWLLPCCSLVLKGESHYHLSRDLGELGNIRWKASSDGLLHVFDKCFISILSCFFFLLSFITNNVNLGEIFEYLDDNILSFMLLICSSCRVLSHHRLVVPRR